MSAVRAFVDAEAGLVRVDDDALPFDLDLRSNSVTLELHDQTIRLRPLLWREKIALARFAHLGLPFVKRQFVRLAVQDGGRVPDGSLIHEALWALALWLNDPAGESSAPFDPQQLAAITLAVCRTTGLKPADLDGRDAMEIEAMWRAGRTIGLQPSESQSAYVASDESAEQVQIMVVPDPQENVALEVQHDVSSAVDDRAVPQRVSVPRNSERPAFEHRTARSNVQRQPEATTGAPHRELGSFRISQPPIDAGGKLIVSALPNNVSTLPNNVSTLPNNGAIVSDLPTLIQAQAPVATATPAMLEPEIAAAHNIFIEDSWIALQSAQSAPIAVEAPPRMRSASRSPSAAVLREHGAAAIVGDALPTTFVETISTSSARLESPVLLDESQREALFETLSERLEQAAAELGIDLEG